jgi:alkylated DNA nucleotide flippase Atl1
MSDEEKVLKVILDHPDGVSAAQIGEWVGLTPQQAGRIATQLADDQDEPVFKDESTKLYHAVTSDVGA